MDPKRTPELRLFVSFDIEGSTKFKQDSESCNGSLTWGPFFRTFFERFPNSLKNYESKLIANYPGPTRPEFELWKTLGDEIIFQKPLIGGLDVFIGIVAARQALIEGANLFRSSALERNKRDEQIKFPSQLKATAWVAGFPNKNISINNSNLPHGYDFIGPSIDLGFRIAKYASASRMPISLNLAWMLAKILTNPKTKQRLNQQGGNIHISYLGRESLKGIDKNGENYPIFYLNTSESITDLPESEAILTKDSESLQVINFCETQNSFMNSRVFILNDIDDLFEFPDENSPAAKKYIEYYNSSSLPEPVTGVSDNSSKAEPENVKDDMFKNIEGFYERIKDQPPPNPSN